MKVGVVAAVVGLLIGCASCSFSSSGCVLRLAPPCFSLLRFMSSPPSCCCGVTVARFRFRVVELRDATWLDADFRRGKGSSA